MRSHFILAACTSLVLAFPALAGKTVDQQALVRMPVEVRNAGHSPIRCQVEIAHWYAADLAVIAPGASASLDLRFHPPSTTWATMNAGGEALPVERAWCGVDGRTYETRWMIELVRQNPAARTVECQAEATGLSCR